MGHKTPIVSISKLLDTCTSAVPAVFRGSKIYISLYIMIYERLLADVVANIPTQPKFMAVWTVHADITCVKTYANPIFWSI